MTNHQTDRFSEMSFYLRDKTDRFDETISNYLRGKTQYSGDARSARQTLQS